MEPCRSVPRTLLVLVLAGSPAVAQSPSSAAPPPPILRLRLRTSADEVVLETALAEAMSHSPELTRAAAAVAEARGRLVAARTYPYNPQIEVEGADRSGADGGSTTDRGLALSQQIEIAGQRGKRIAEARAPISRRPKPGPSACGARCARRSGRLRRDGPGPPAGRRGGGGRGPDREPARARGAAVGDGCRHADRGQPRTRRGRPGRATAAGGERPAGRRSARGWPRRWAPILPRLPAPSASCRVPPSLCRGSESSTRRALAERADLAALRSRRERAVRRLAWSARGPFPTSSSVRSPRARRGRTWSG